MNPQTRKFAENALRRASYRWGPRYAASVSARISRGQYRCNNCNLVFGLKETQMDHKDPVVPITGPTSLDIFAERLLVPKSGWQRLCKTCHKDKTKKENALRHANNKKSTKHTKKAKNKKTIRTK